MHDYIKLRINCDPCSEDITDLLAAFLADEGFESFLPDEAGMEAFIRKDQYNEGNVKKVLEDFPMDVKFDFSSTTEKGKDWNSEWEKNYFKPIVIGGECGVHSSFHTDFPKVKYDILIDPKLAFGTGHHATTGNMLRFILEEDLKGKNVIDMGTGTGILSILCKMKGASVVLGIEIDPFAAQNAEENVKLNECDVKILCGDVSVLKTLPGVDFFMANINRNVILQDVAEYAKNLKSDGKMFLSGFYMEDIPMILKECEKVGLTFEGIKEENNWVAIRLVKN